MLCCCFCRLTSFVCVADAGKCIGWGCTTGGLDVFASTCPCASLCASTSSNSGSSRIYFSSIYMFPLKIDLRIHNFSNCFII